MKLSALANVLVASFTVNDKCTPKELRCNDRLTGWDICDASGQWTSSVKCPPATFCRLRDGQPTCNMPFHITEVDVEVEVAPKCKEGTYRCHPSKEGWELCNSMGDWMFAGACPRRTECKLNELSGGPDCVFPSTLKASDECRPATYRCEPNKKGWDVCNTSGDWVFAGRCPPGTACRFNQANGSPYCLPRRTLTASNTIEDSHKCKPATYRCEPNKRGWDVCNTSGDWVFAGRCPHGTVCKFNKQNNSPYCLPRGGFNAEIVMGDKGSEDDVEVGDVEVDVEVEL